MDYRRAVAQASRAHLLGIDDGPFEKHVSREVPVVGVLMEGHDLVEGVAVSRFPVDGDGATDFLVRWVSKLRFRDATQGIVLGGITIAGLGIVDVAALACALALPVLVVNRRDPSASRLREALEAAHLRERTPLVDRAPTARCTRRGTWLACAGIGWERGAELVEASVHKSDLPEPLRLAHLIARAVGRGESRGRV